MISVCLFSSSSAHHFVTNQVPDWTQQPVSISPWFKLTANNDFFSFYVSIKIISYIVHAWQLHNNLLLDFVVEISKKKKKRLPQQWAIVFCIDYVWQQWWWVLRLACVYRERAWIYSSRVLVRWWWWWWWQELVSIFVTNLAYLGKEKRPTRWTCRNKNNQIRPLITIILLTA